MSNQKLLEVRNLTTTFTSDDNKVIAVNDISFTLYRGETLGIVGESGSGKSVTALSLMRLISTPPGNIENGEILLYKENGEAIDILKLSEKEMSSVRGNEMAMIFQEPMTSLNPVFTCGYQVVEAIQIHQKKDKITSKNIALDLFKKVQLEDSERIFNAYPHQLSGGQKQRVMIAMAMSCKPNILIADEPTTSLDVTVQKTILQLMRSLQKELKSATIFITHDLGVIAELADRVLVMYQGKIVEEGKVLNIFQKPSHPYTQGLLACRPALDRHLKRLPTVSDFMQLNKEGNPESVSADIDQKLKQWIKTSDDENKRAAKMLNAQTILEIKDLGVWYPKQTNFWGTPKEYIKAVDNVSLEMKQGETLGLVGESGSGKSSLGRAIMRLTPSKTGEILYHGKNILDLSASDLKDFRREMQIVFQDPYSSLNPRMTVGEAILEPMTVHGIFQNEKERRDAVLDLLHKVNLQPEYYSRYPHEFSGGQRQRICIARALALQPKFIICDESVSALDVSVQAQVLNLLADLRDQFDFSYIFISHDLSVVKFISDRIAVMKQGKIVELQDAESLYAHPKSEYTKSLIHAIPMGEVEDIKNRMNVASR